MTIATTGRQKALLTATLLACSSQLAGLSHFSVGAGKHSRLYRPAEPLYRAGRNEPCPCGSGKRFKKCCVGRVKSVE